MAGARSKPAWLLLAIASGACAAFNGVFAKLTTTELTTSWASAVSKAFDLSPSNKVVEFSIRGIFFGLNLLFNIVMWGLFTRALTLASSTVRVSVINTSANFMITAVLGALIFSEALPGLWWLGAALLVAGSVIIGRREEGNKAAVEATTGIEPLLERNSGDGAGFKDDDDEQDRQQGVELDNVKGDDDEESGNEDEDGVLK
ncbi:uncharacterized protein BDR25DRAFT_302014 [Lindgomyces ingoldianus]|uniref:Uncharacterized protein n=1 Tax=Lindgomyces ingoldianus TaxID=673940 RepID=A0ACB6R3Y0_9PLEO|nr:uncharacterized protein BDR25DRAFT_302014 [Lindgomyces ingoldianus]KAF2473954.1 hypothetical protein BDR25DRAFT_302014 [Lindgomyces ingoldianus]